VPSPRPVHQPQSRLTRDAIVDAAIALIERDGADRLSMRRLGAELGVEAMSLYHHVPGKEALLDGLVEALVAEIEADLALSARPEEDWHAEVRRRSLTAREVMKRHPWAPGLLASRSTIPADVFGLYEAVLAALVEGGFSYSLAHRSLHALGSLVLGFAQEVFSPNAAGASADDAPPEAELERLAETLPHLTAMVASELHDHEDDPLGWCDSQTEFEFTLDLILDGLRGFLPAR
jgi:AcrR family transcriptional regulator